MVTGSNLATIRNSVDTIARITQDWLPNFLQSLNNKLLIQLHTHSTDIKETIDLTF